MTPGDEARCLVCHLDWEEAEIFPRLRARGFGEVVDELLADHARFRELLAAGELPSPGELAVHALAEELVLGGLLELATHATDGRMFPAVFADWHELRRDHVALEHAEIVRANG